LMTIFAFAVLVLGAGCEGALPALLPVAGSDAPPPPPPHAVSAAASIAAAARVSEDFPIMCCGAP
jgi:hypothetical protein